MELYQLNTFVKVATERNLSRAAARLNISQPSVSAHIKSLEQELGVSLFLRTNKGMEPTKAGLELKKRAEKALAAINDIHSHAKALRSILTGNLTLGLHTDPALLKISELIVFLKVHFPGLECRILRNSTWDVLEGLRQELLDGGFIYGKNPFSEINALRLACLNLLVTGPVQWEKHLAKAEWEDVARLPWIWFPEYCPFHQSAIEMLRSHNVELQKATVVDDEITISNLVSSGLGLSLMIETEARAGERKKQLVVWEKGHVKIDLSFAYLAKRKDDPIIQAIIKGLHSIWGIRTP